MEATIIKATIIKVTIIKVTLGALVLSGGLAGVQTAGAADIKADVTVAVVGPMTGQYATYGDQLRRGAEKAVADINAKGGILGNKLQLVVGDDACDPKQAVAVANQMAARGVALVDGHYCSSSSIPASAIYNDTGILQISPASTNPRFTDEPAAKGWTNIFRISGRDDDQGATAAKYIAANFAGKRLALVHDKSAYGKGLVDEMKKAVNRAGLQEVLYDSVSQGEKDFTSLITLLKQKAIDVVYFGGYHAEAGLIVRQARDQGLNTRFIGGDTLMTEEFYKITGASGDGTLMTFHPDPRRNPAARTLVEQFQAQGIDPTGYTLYSYSVMQVFAQAAQAAGSLDMAKVSTLLRSGKVFDTAVGILSFDWKGDVATPDFVFYEWRNGGFSQL